MPLTSNTPRDIEAYVGEQMSAPLRLPIFNVADLPPAARYRNCMVQVPNETGGAVPAFSDGTNWRRVTDRAICS